MTFNYSVSPNDWLGIAPLVVLVIVALVVMLVDLVLPHEGERSKHTGPANFLVLPLVSLLGIVAAIVVTAVMLGVGVGASPNNHTNQIFNNMMGTDAGTLVAYLIILSAGALGTFLSPAYLKRLNLVHQGEYYALLLFAMAGMMLMAGSTSFIILFVGLEMFSLALYILCGFVARRFTSQEAGMKYFLLSSFASAFLLFGVALTYAATGSTAFSTVASFVHGHAPASPLLIAAMSLLIVGFAFKVSGVPFQAWTPDVYQGAPAPITAFMSVGTKVAAFVAFVRVFGFVLIDVRNDWLPIIVAISIVTMVGGNFMALAQSNVKRLLAYSSIAHGGYLLIGVAVGGADGASAILFYMACYLFMNIGAFGVISLLEKLDNTGYSNEDLRGLWHRRPVLAGTLAFFLLSLAGFPPMAGFAAKYYIFYVALSHNLGYLMLIGVLTSVLGIYYYLRPVATMFMQESEAEDLLAGYEATPALRTGVLKAPSVPVTPRRGATGALARGGAATAVAVKPSGKIAKTPLPEPVVEQEKVGEHGWMSWTGLALAVVGTLVMGVVLPFWLSNLVSAAQTLLMK